MWWLTNRVDITAAPARQVVIDLTIRGPRGNHGWLVIQNGTDPSLCAEDPQLAEERYVYVEADAGALLPIGRGARSWTDAIAEGSVEVYGDPALVHALPLWFLAVGLPTVPIMRGPLTEHTAAPAVA